MDIGCRKTTIKILKILFNLMVKKDSYILIDLMSNLKINF